MSEIIVQTGIHRSTLKSIITDFKESKLSASDVLQLSDEALHEIFKKAFENVQSETLQILYGLFPEIDRELKRKGVTKM